MINGISFLGLQISWYSILGFTGLVAAGLLCFSRRKKYQLPGDDILNLVGYALIGAVVGSKILALLCVLPYIIKYWDLIQWNAEFFNLLMSTGFVYYGGLIGVVVMFYIYCKQFKMNFANIMELLAPGVPMFHVFGRIGCYITGCCGGINGFPLQLVEAAMNLVICIVLLVIQDKELAKGKTFLLYMILYGIGRFVLEFYRGDPERGFIGMFSVSQWISIAFIVIAVILWKKVEKRRRE